MIAFYEHIVSSAAAAEPAMPQAKKKHPSQTDAAVPTPKLVGILERRAVGRDARSSEPCTLVEWALEGDGGPTRDPRGEELVLALADRLRKEGKRFEDEYFPPSDDSLYQFAAPLPAAVDKAEEDADGVAKSAARIDHSKFCHGADGKPLSVVWARGSEIAARRGLPPSAAVIFSKDPNDPTKLTVDPDDIAQGALGDCWFLAAIASCAASESDRLIKDLIIEEGWDVGLIGVKFFVRGRWTTVIIDDFFPLKPPKNQKAKSGGSDGSALLFASPKAHARQRTDEVEFWPMVLEKAFAKLHGSWEAIGANGGSPEDALSYLTGAPLADPSPAATVRSFSHFPPISWAFPANILGFRCSFFEANSRRYLGQLLKGAEPEHAEAAWLQLKDLIKDPDDVDEKVGFVSASLKRSLTEQEVAATGLVTGHAYSVLACFEARAERGQILRDGSAARGPGLTFAGEIVRLVCVRNPWGSDGWEGAYRDSDSERWTEQLVALAKAANPDAEVMSRTSSGKVDSAGSDDGSFWMEWADVQQYLDLGACNPFALEVPRAEATAGLLGEWAVRPGCALARVMTYRGEWRAAESTAGGCTAGLFQFNPRLRITSTAAECTVYVTLSVPDLRFLKPDADQNPELFERYGLRYPSVCVLVHGARSSPVQFSDLPTDGAGFYDPLGVCQSTNNLPMLVVYGAILRDCLWLQVKWVGCRWCWMDLRAARPRRSRWIRHRKAKTRARL